MEGKYVQLKNNIWHINKSVNCESSNIVYLIECNKDNCRDRYIGETKRSLMNHLAEHRGYVINHKYNMPTGAHFNTTGHNLSNMRVTILEQVMKLDDTYRKQREEYYIKKFNTFHAGMNKKE